MSSDSWAGLSQELDHWQALGRTATLWCRDDDACEASTALERLVSLSAAAKVPIALAVIPRGARDSLTRYLEDRELVQVLVHGLAHINHAPDGEKRAEFGAHRPVESMLTDVREAWSRIQQLFAERALPLFVPPWNRIAPELVERLAEAGLRGLSTYTVRTTSAPAPGVSQVNCHADIIDWRGTRSFVGEVEATQLLVDHLRDRRLGVVDAEEATGLLTHHRDHDAACWAYLEQLWALTASHPAARWLRATEAAWPV